ncbi:MAG: hypothetical protein ABI572_06595 [Actinomycetota bacterium]
MRRTVRIAVLVLVASLMLALAPIAQAGQYIGYRGRTDQQRRAQAVVHRTELGRLFLIGIANGYTLTCGDSTTQEWLVGAFFSPGFRLDGNRRVHINENWGDVAIHYNGRMAWRGGTGTTKWSVASLDADEQAMLCTSGRQGWTLLRRGSTPARLDEKDVALGIGYARVRVGTGGVTRLVRFRPPLAR